MRRKIKKVKIISVRLKPMTWGKLKLVPLIGYT